MKNQKQYYLLTIFENSSDLYNGFEEMIRERVYHYKRSSTPLDFWVIKNIKYNKNLELIEKKFNLNLEISKELTNLSKGFTIITTNKIFFEWVKLRYGYFENITQNLNLNFLKNPEYTIDGISLNLDVISFIQRKSQLFKN